MLAVTHGPRLLVAVTVISAMSMACRVDSTAPKGGSAAGELRIGDPEENRLYGEPRTGYMRGPDGRPVLVRFTDVNGIGYYQGDIILGPVDGIPTSPDQIPSRRGPQLGVAIDDYDYRWVSNHVPYVIDGSIQNDAEILAGIALIAQKTRVTFAPYQGQIDYVRFVASNECSSYVGRQGGAQVIRIDESRCFRGSVAHEISHALGMWHEMSRCDRDTYVTIQWANVQGGVFNNNFEAHCAGATDYLQYDEHSIMHYSQFQGCTNPCNGPTIVSKRGLGAVMGQRDSLSVIDRQTIDTLYLPFVGGYLAGPDAMHFYESGTWEAMPSGGSGNYGYGEWTITCQGGSPQSLGYWGKSITLIPYQKGCYSSYFTLTVYVYGSGVQGNWLSKWVTLN